MILVRHGGDLRGRRAPLYAGLAVALGLGLAAASGHGVAWADSDGAGARGGPVSHSDPGTDTGGSAGPRSPARSAPSDPAKPNSAAGSARNHWGGHRSSTHGSQTAKATTHPETPEDTSGPGSDGASAKPSLAETASTAPPVSTAAVHEPVVIDTPGRGTRRAATASSGHAASPPAALHTSEPVSPAAKTAAVTTTPRTPTPLSPIARLLAVPAHIVNQVLELVGVTTAAGTPASPVMPGPVVDLVYAAFRRLENIAGLDSPTAAQPVPIGQPFTGSLTTPTPTVAQFQNASTAEYVLGGVPGGLTPFTTADGRQMTSTSILTVEAAEVWVTPQKQIIIAYQGTTGGTNLLFNPLIVVSQFFTDLQGIFTKTTPAAFHDSLRFARQVQAEAAQQGYEPDSIFVTGHSLGGWEAEYVAQHTGMGGIGFESLGLSSTVPGNGADSLFVNTSTYGDPAGYASTDLPGLQPFTSYVAGGGSKPHYGSIVLLGDPSAQTPLTNAAALWGPNIIGDLIYGAIVVADVTFYHLPGVQAHSLDVNPDPGVVPWLDVDSGPIHTGYGELTIPEFLQATSAAGILVKP